MAVATKSRRKKVNFMIEQKLFEDLESLIPAGERSDFMNDALEEAIIDFSRKKASKWMEEFKEKNKIKMTTKEILKTIRYGRK